MHNRYEFFSQSDLGDLSPPLPEPSSALATLTDLPNELLSMIVTDDLDNECLLNLGLTCRRMNTIALNYFFFKNKIQDPGTAFSWRSDLPIQTIPALRSA